MNRISAFRIGKWVVPCVGLFAIGMGLAGCQESDSHVATTPEIKAADSKRQAYIDTLNVPDAQKAIMKSHMGGPPAASPMDAARAGAAPPTGRRN